MYSTPEDDCAGLVKVRLFAAARERAGADMVEVTVPAEALLADVRAALAAQYAPLGPIARHLLFAVDYEYVADDAPVPKGREIVAFPPVSGG